MQKPTIHLNGSGKRHLADTYRDANEALYQAIKALEQAAPNARDYYPQGPDAYRQASKEHAERLAKLVQIRQEIDELCDHCSQ